MEVSKQNVVVLPSFSELGMVAKSERGLVSDRGELPEALKGVCQALARVGNKLGVDLTQPVDGLIASFDGALKSRNSQQLQPTGLDVNAGPTAP